MTQVPFAPWEPDQSGLDPNAADVMKNVIPRSRSYGPFPALVSYSGALAGVCRGAKTAIAVDGTFSIFAGTADSLYKASGTSWTDVTNGSATYALATGHSWQFETFGNDVIAVNVNDPPQVYTLGSSTDFADLAGSPPQARYVWQESGYLDLGNISGSERKIRRSAYQNDAGWSNGIDGASEQEIPDGGVVQGGHSNEGGAVVFQERRIHQLTDQPGQEIGFTLSDIESARGVVAPDSVVVAGQSFFGLCDDGFYQFGKPSDPIGVEKIDETFFADIDTDYIDQVQGVYDQKRKIAWWRYKSNSGGSAAYTDKLIGYYIPAKRWCYAEIDLEWLLMAGTPGYTLEELDSVLGFTNIDAMTESLDSARWRGGRPILAGFGTDHKLGFFTGAALEAILETADIPYGGEGLRGYVSGFRAIGDVPSGAYGALATAERYGDELMWNSEVAENGTGLISVRGSGRRVRLRYRVPAGTIWTYLHGIEIPADHGRSLGRQ